MEDSKLFNAPRKADVVGRGWMQDVTGWKEWPDTFKALSTSYYATGFPQADQQYAIAGLTRFRLAWIEEHGFRNIPQAYLDQAAAHEVNYHAYRGRLFKRPCAALSTCWTAIVCERPERVIDRHGRAIETARRKAKKHLPA